MLDVFRTERIPPFFSTRVLSRISAMRKYICVAAFAEVLLFLLGAMKFSLSIWLVLIDNLIELFVFLLFFLSIGIEHFGDFFDVGFGLVLVLLNFLFLLWFLFSGWEGGVTAFDPVAFFREDFVFKEVDEECVEG